MAPRDFPLELADYLRANEIDVEAQGELFDGRRRVKTAAELDGHPPRAACLRGARWTRSARGSAPAAR